jgi:carboxymethylenebutenolidase
MMPAMHETLTIHTADGACPAHVYRPDGTGPWPGVLFYIDGIGMRPAMHEMADRLAKAGYYVLMPDLFWRAGEYTAPDPKALFSDPAVRTAWFQKVFAHAQPPLIIKDTRAFLDHLEQSPHVSPKQVGITGYCMGGRLALTAAGSYPEEIAAAAAYHPGGLVTDAADSPHLLAPKIKAKVYVGGAMEDANFTDEQRATLERALTEAGVDHTVEKYEARHGWVPSDTPVHDAALAERHWTTLTGLLQRALRG